MHIFNKYDHFFMTWRQQPVKHPNHVIIVSCLWSFLTISMVVTAKQVCKLDAAICASRAHIFINILLSLCFLSQQSFSAQRSCLTTWLMHFRNQILVVILVLLSWANIFFYCCLSHFTFYLFLIAWVILIFKTIIRKSYFWVCM